MNAFNFLVSNDKTHQKFNGGDFHRGSQRVFRFPNGFGASVVKTVYGRDGIADHGTYGATEGLYELAVTEWTSAESWGICYSTPITSDVLGWLSADDVEATLEEIRALWIV